MLLLYLLLLLGGGGGAGRTRNRLNSACWWQIKMFCLHLAGSATVAATGDGDAHAGGLAVEMEQLIPQNENATTSQVTALMGQTVMLPCKAYSLGQRTVSVLRVESIQSFNSRRNQFLPPTLCPTPSARFSAAVSHLSS